MIPLYIYPIASVLIVSAISLIGLSALVLNENALRQYIFAFVSLAVGALLGDAFIHLIPEAFESAVNPLAVSLSIISGILIFFVLEKILHWHHHAHSDEQENHIHHTGPMILVSDAVHNLIDGIIIGASYFVSIEVGIATTIAVILHEIPQEIGDFGVLINAGYTKAKALCFNLISALTAVIGVLITIIFKDAGNIVDHLLPIAAGGFIYIAMSDLVPELHKTKNTKQSLIQIIAILVGIGAMFLLLYLE